MSKPPLSWIQAGNVVWFSASQNDENTNICRMQKQEEIFEFSCHCFRVYFECFPNQIVFSNPFWLMTASAEDSVWFVCFLLIGNWLQPLSFVVIQFDSFVKTWRWKRNLKADDVRLRIFESFDLRTNASNFHRILIKFKWSFFKNFGSNKIFVKRCIR